MAVVFVPKPLPLPMYGPFTRLKLNINYFREKELSKPTASEVLTKHLNKQKRPPWTSYFVRYDSVLNDHFGLSNFNWTASGVNYQILRTGCYPYIKYHCSRKEPENLRTLNAFCTYIKALNFGKLI